MASETVSLGPNHVNNPMFWSVHQRRENKKLRNAGLEYISRSGKTVAAKKQPGNRYQQYNNFCTSIL